jgi:hypothetical protein
VTHLVSFAAGKGIVERQPVPETARHFSNGFGLLLSNSLRQNGGVERAIY